MSGLYKEGLNRNQQLLLPPSLDDYVNEDNPVRAIDAYVELLDLINLGFSNTRKSNRADGQKAYHPKMLLKIYIYGYLNKIRSSRALEKEIKRNIELMWLTQGLAPSYKTIADFRKENPKALREVFKAFVLLCKNIDLIEGRLVALDGAFLRANASKNRLIMKKGAVRELQKVEASIEEYFNALEYSDTQTSSVSLVSKLPRDIEKLQTRKQKLETDLALLESLKKEQYNRTDPDASLMSKPAHNLMAYNAQIAVDDSYKFIIATDVTSEGSDKKELHRMAKQVQESVNNDAMTLTADKGYYSTVEIKQCADDNITTVVPPIRTGQEQKNKGKFGKEMFVYDPKQDGYICPNNQLIPKSHSNHTSYQRTMDIYRTSSKVCGACPIKEKCLGEKTKHKQIQRWEHQQIIDDYNGRMKTEASKTIIKKRGSIVEHPFGTIKRTLGWDHYLVRGKEKVSGENALIMFTYNFRRLLNLIGIALFQKLMVAVKEGNIEAIKAEIALHIASFLTNVRLFFSKLPYAKKSTRFRVEYL
jgi:transposase